MQEVVTNRSYPYKVEQKERDFKGGKKVSKRTPRDLISNNRLVTIHPNQWNFHFSINIASERRFFFSSLYYEKRETYVAGRGVTVFDHPSDAGN